MKKIESPRAGQVVRLIGSFDGPIVGKVVGTWDVEGWSKIETEKGIFTWPDSQLEAITSTEVIAQFEAELDAAREMNAEADNYDPEGEWF